MKLIRDKIQNYLDEHYPGILVEYKYTFIKDGAILPNELYIDSEAADGVFTYTMQCLVDRLKENEDE